MRALLLATLVVLSTSMMLPANRPAEAKSFAFVITGGELGPYAYHFFVAPEADIVLYDSGASPVAPDPLPAPAYDLYSSWGNFAVSFQLASGSPEFRYYPEPRLIHRIMDDVWLNASSATLDPVVSEALARKEAGQLELGPVAADFRARHMPEFTYHMTSYAAAGSGNREPGLQDMRRSEEPRGDINQPDARAFIMQDLVQTVSGAPKFNSNTPSKLRLFYSGRVGDTGYGGLLGLYTPPADRRPGRFWPEDSNFYDGGSPYYETTPGFDAVIARALESGQESGASDGGSNAIAAGGRDVSLAVAAGLGAVLVLASAAGATYVVRRVRRGE